MKIEKRCAFIRNTLLSAISKVASDPDKCVVGPGRDFTRNRKLPLSTILQMLIGMGGGSLMKELHEWFDLPAHTASISAFVQQRNKIKPEALEFVFHHFLNTVSLPGTCCGYRLLAVDGSDLRLPTNSGDSFSLIQNEEGGKHYNLVHLNAMYDLVNHTCLQGFLSQSAAAEQIGVDMTAVMDWVRLYQSEGTQAFLPREGTRRYAGQDQWLPESFFTA